MAGWRRAGLVVVLVLAAGAGRWYDSAAAAGETADLLVEGKWVPTPVTTVADLRDFRPVAEVELSRYGGWKARQIEATGFFRTRRVGGRWWLVDPEGYLFLSVGLCSVDRKGVESTPVVADRIFGSRENWASVTATLLRTLGFNSLGCWSDAEPFRALAQPMPYFPRWNFMSTYKNQRDPRDGPRGYPNQCMPLFDAAFKSFCLRHAEQLAATKDDPYLVGHFSDNELPFRPDLLKLYLQLPDTDSGHQAARRWLTQFRQEHKIAIEAEVSETEQPDELVVGLSWYGLGSMVSWPDSLGAFRTMGLNTISNHAHWIAKPGAAGYDEQWALWDEAREQGFKLLNIDSTFHRIP